MDNYEPKKLLLIRILEILTEYSDCEHKLKQGDIMRLLKIVYGIECERKAVARNIEFLQQAGYDIENDRTGTYLATRKFEVGELRLLIDSVLSNRNVCKIHSKDLIAKLTAEGGKFFKNYAKHVVNLDDWQKANNAEYFYKIELLAEAIENKKKIEFCYCTYGVDKKLHKRKDKTYTASPYQMILKNGYYYLMCNYDNHENIVFCRIDRMTEISIVDSSVCDIKQINGYEHGISLGDTNNRLPYMFEDKPEQITFEIDNYLINDIVDWFGYDFSIKELADNKVLISLMASPRAIRFWILQFGKFVKVLTPQSLVDTIKEDIQEMTKLYN